ncbi:protein kinase domain-containing protein [Seiridium cupressi]
MADIVGAVAAIIAILETVAEAIKVSKELYKAPREICMLEGVFKTNQLIFGNPRAGRCSYAFPSPFQEAKPVPDRCNPEHITIKHNLQSVSSASIFEFLVDRTFRPEIYTSLEATPRMFSYADSPGMSNDFTRVIEYQMFYSASPRSWVRVNVSVTLNPDSLLSTDLVTSGTEIADFSRWSFGLPHNLTEKLCSFLDKSQVKQDSCMSLWLGATEKLALCVRQPEFQPAEYLKGLAETLRHRNCPLYPESSVIQQSLHTHIHNCEFIAYVDSRWVSCWRFGSDKSQVDSLLYMLDAFLCLRGTRGIGPLVGVVIDDTTGVVTGVMVEVPGKGNLNSVLTKPVEWRQRLVWCKQLIEIISEIHAAGFVVGQLGQAPTSFTAVDANNDIVFRVLQTTFAYDVETGTLPPEYRGKGLKKGFLKACPQTDVYHLGMLLWRLAANQHYEVKRAQLPELGDNIPQALKDIIAACRAEDPDQRPPAWRILEMFAPLDDKDNTALSDPPLARANVQKSLSWLPKRPEECRNLFGGQVDCDLCRTRSTEHYFHCQVCLRGDFDICRNCFSNGRHCFDESHYLREMRSSKPEEKYHSSPRENGRRDVTSKW